MRFIKFEKWAGRVLLITILWSIVASTLKINNTYSEYKLDRTTEISKLSKYKSIISKKIFDNINYRPVDLPKLSPGLIVNSNNRKEQIKPSVTVNNTAETKDVSSFIDFRESENPLMKNTPQADPALFKTLLVPSMDFPVFDNKDIAPAKPDCYNCFNYSETLQRGNENTAVHEFFDGMYNFSRIVQHGNYNYARHVNSVDLNYIQTFQSGDFNFSDIISNSTGNTAIVNQTGSWNKSVIRQSGMQ